MDWGLQLRLTVLPELPPLLDRMDGIAFACLWYMPQRAASFQGSSSAVSLASRRHTHPLPYTSSKVVRLTGTTYLFLLQVDLRDVTNAEKYSRHREVLE